LSRVNVSVVSERNTVDSYAALVHLFIAIHYSSLFDEQF